MMYKNSIQRFIAPFLIAPMMFFQVCSELAISASPSLRTAPRTGQVNPRKALWELAQTVHGFRAGRDEQTFGPTLDSLNTAWRNFQRVLQLKHDQIGDLAARSPRSSPVTAARRDVIERLYMHLSSDLQAEYEGFMRQARQGPAAAQAAAETFGATLDSILGLSSLEPSGNPIPHRLALSRPFDSGRLRSRPSITMRPADVSAVPTYLASTDDATITPEITALASQLNGDPVQIYSYVLNQILFDPYFGSRKGSLLTHGNAAATTSISQVC